LDNLYNSSSLKILYYITSKYATMIAYFKQFLNVVYYYLQSKLTKDLLNRTLFKIKRGIPSHEIKHNEILTLGFSSLLP